MVILFLLSIIYLFNTPYALLASVTVISITALYYIVFLKRKKYIQHDNQNFKFSLDAINDELLLYGRDYFNNYTLELDDIYEKVNSLNTNYIPSIMSQIHDNITWTKIYKQVFTTEDRCFRSLIDIENEVALLIETKKYDKAYSKTREINIIIDTLIDLLDSLNVLETYIPILIKIHDTTTMDKLFSDTKTELDTYEGLNKDFYENTYKYQYITFDKMKSFLLVSDDIENYKHQLNRIKPKLDSLTSKIKSNIKVIKNKRNEWLKSINNIRR